MAILRELDNAEEISICAGNEKVQHGYLSKTSTLDIIIPRNTRDKQFLLKYEGQCSCSKATNVTSTLSIL